MLPRPGSNPGRLALVLGCSLWLAGCGGHESPTAPTPAAPVVPGASSGNVRIQFSDATPAPGSTVSGCGTDVAGCTNRIAMRFRLVPPQSGPVLFVRAFLHASNRQACLFTESGPFTLTAGQPRDLDIVFDRADRCGVPLTIETMAVVVEGTVEVASRQEWTIAYTLRP